MVCTLEGPPGQEGILCPSTGMAKALRTEVIAASATFLTMATVGDLLRIRSFPPGLRSEDDPRYDRGNTRAAAPAHTGGNPGILHLETLGHLPGLGHLGSGAERI